MKSLQYYENLRCFSTEQLHEIKLGLEKGINVSVYADFSFIPEKMRDLRFDLEEDLYPNSLHTF